MYRYITMYDQSTTTTQIRRAEWRASARRAWPLPRSRPPPQVSRIYLHALTLGALLPAAGPTTTRSSHLSLYRPRVFFFSFILVEP